MTNQELIDYYTNLLIVQYNNKPKARGTVAALIEVLIASQLPDQVLNAFDVDTAIGLQLTVLAKYVDAPRDYLGIDIGRTYFAMPSYDEASPEIYVGFYSYIDDAYSSYFVRYTVTNTIFTLTDDELRKLVKYMIDLNKWDGTLYGIDQVMYTHFGTTVKVVETQMELEYIFYGEITDRFVAIAALNALLPKPAGCTVTVSYM